MKGAIIGDIVGSIYEGHSRNVESKDSFPLFQPSCRFTDDTVQTVAVAEHLMTGAPLAPLLKRYYFDYRGRGYGRNFKAWVHSNSLEPYNSLGNGSAMRVSPVAFWGKSLEEVLELATSTAAVTHNHPKGIEGAKAIAVATFLARTGATKADIAEAIYEYTHYNPEMTMAEAVRIYDCGASCPQSCPVAIVAFMESTDFEDCIRRAIAAGGDSDTIAAMAGSIAEPFYGIPPKIEAQAMAKLHAPLREVVEKFYGLVGPSPALS